VLPWAEGDAVIVLLGAQPAAPGPGTLLVVALVVLAVYLLDCAIWPRVKHRACGGTGRLTSPMSGAERDCWCDRGRRRRWGARLLGR
jgi:hypothetical protein